LVRGETYQHVRGDKTTNNYIDNAKTEKFIKLLIKK
tara:strand:- start:431 stop:538 length:108 start_codon:yes stop_codon:yes gene_type:complete